MTGAALPITAHAQTAAADRPGDTVLDPIILKNADGQANVNKRSTKISRLPATIKETPKVVNVVPKEIIEQQRATTLDQVLRNVPGITLSSGEGFGGQSGSQFRIRGLQARSDIYIDGLKDFGVYSRDTFNTDDVQVLKGPSGDSFGSGNTGGLINQSSKRAELNNFTKVEQSIGSGMTYRSTFDGNYQINDTTAVRANGVIQNQDTPDRDHIKADRRGVAFDIGMGLGTETEWHLNYSYLHGDGIPDYGQPMVEGADGIFLPAAEFGFDPSISYARSVNRDITNNHAISSHLTHEVNDWLTLSNDTRLTIYDRDFAGTPPGPCAGACAANFFDVLNGGGDPTARFRLGAGGGLTYKQEGWAIQNVTTGKMEFDTGNIRHKATIGLDIAYQTDKRTNTFIFESQSPWPNWTDRNMESLFNPQYSYDFQPAYNHDGARRYKTTDIGIFVSDRIYLTDEFSVMGGLRFNQFHTRLESNAVSGGRTDSAWNPSAAVIWEPTADYMLYASYARTTKPSTTDIAALSPIESIFNFRSNEKVDFSPEKSEVFEIGGKADLLDGRLGLTGALFQINKDHSTDSSTSLPADGLGEVSTGLRIRGVELGVSGKITDAWNVYANYAYLDGEITSSVNPAEVGFDAPDIPRHNFNLWTAYTIAEELPDNLPGKLTVGGGFQYASEYFVNTGNTAKVPETFSLDAVVSYEYKNFRVALNGYNLTDHQNYLSAFRGSRAVPASGPTYTVTVGAKF